MSSLTGQTPASDYGGLLNVNAGPIVGLTNVLQQVTDGFGNPTPLQLSTIALNIIRSGYTFQLDGVAVTSQAVDINSMSAPNPIALGEGSLTLPVGPTIARPLIPTEGMERFNTDLSAFEGFDGFNWVSFATGSTITEILGTPDRITVSGTSIVTIDIAATYAGQTSINTVGTITNGTWHGSTITEVYGGTGQSSYIVGDILFASATNTLSKLPGNITTTTLYLSQHGDGTNAFMPVWNAITGTDITGAALSRVNDVNVTLTLGGSPLTALLRDTSLTLGWTGQLALSRGGTGAALVASNGGLVYSNATTLAILPGTPVANRIPLSGANSAPIWSTATYPAALSINQLLYSSATNVISGLTSGLNSVLVSTNTGAPIWSGALLNGQLIVGSTGATPIASNLTAGTGISITNGPGSITINALATGSGSTLTKNITQAAHGFAVGNLVYLNGAIYTLALATSVVTAEVVGIITSIIDANNFVLTTSGYITGFGGLVAGSVFFVSDSTPGLLTTVAPSAVGSVQKPVFVADGTTSGYFINYRGDVVTTPAVGVTSVTGTPNQINSTGGANPVLSLPTTLIAPGTFAVGNLTFNGSSISSTVGINLVPLTPADGVGVQGDLSVANGASFFIKNAGNTAQTSFKATAQLISVDYTLPSGPPAANGYILSSTTTGVWSWIPAPTGSVISVNGTPNQINSTLGANPVLSITNPFNVPGVMNVAGISFSSGVIQSSSIINVVTTATVFSGSLVIGSGNLLQLYNVASTFKTSFAATAQTSDATYTLPPALPAVSGSVLSSTTGGVMTWTVPSGGGLAAWTDVTGATQTLAVNNGYITDRSAGVTYTLPATAALGDQIAIVGKQGIATIAQNAGQQILAAGALSTVGVTGSFVSTNGGDTITLICITAGASTAWRANSIVGNWLWN